MHLIAVLLVAASVWGVVFAWRRRRQRIAEQEALDREYRESVLRRAQVKPRSDREEDYLLKLRAGAKPKTEDAASDPAPRPASNPNKFLD